MERARQTMTKAFRWESLGGRTEVTATSRDLSIDYITHFPKPLAEKDSMYLRLEDLFKEQALKTRMELERLIAMAYHQKARLEANATKDNWARDALGPVDANIAALEDSHKNLSRATSGHYY
jgi:hypothetical protein